MVPNSNGVNASGEKRARDRLDERATAGQEAGREKETEPGRAAIPSLDRNRHMKIQTYMDLKTKAKKWKERL